MALTHEEIQEALKAELVGTPYEVADLKALTGGTGNFIFKAKLRKPLEKGTAEVVLKHGEGYVASHPTFALPTSRCHVEEECLRYLSGLPHSHDQLFSVGTPNMFYFNPKTNTQAQEYLTDARSLKDYALKWCVDGKADSLKPQCLQLGKSLGIWLRSFHAWSDQPEQEELRKIVAENKDMRELKRMVNYDRLVQAVDTYPDILGDVKVELEQIRDMATKELEDKNNDRVTHGDFWTGNVLIPDKPINEDKSTQIRVVDWELAQLGHRSLDIGQMVAELWQLKLYKDIDAGEWLIEGFAGGYGGIDEDAAFRAIIHVGVHLISFGSRTPGWGTPEQGRQLVIAAKDVVLRALRRDGEWFGGHVLGHLLR